MMQNTGKIEPKAIIKTAKKIDSPSKLKKAKKSSDTNIKSQKKLRFAE